MFNPSPSEFQALETDWHAAGRAVAQADLAVVQALKDFRQSGDRSSLVPAMRERQSATGRLRLLMQKIWAEPI